MYVHKNMFLTKLPIFYLVNWGLCYKTQYGRNLWINFRKYLGVNVIKTDYSRNLRKNDRIYGKILL